MWASLADAFGLGRTRADRGDELLHQNCDTGHLVATATTAFSHQPCHPVPGGYRAASDRTVVCRARAAAAPDTAQVQELEGMAAPPGAAQQHAIAEGSKGGLCDGSWQQFDVIVRELHTAITCSSILDDFFQSEPSNVLCCDEALASAHYCD